ncbi:MAG TPA: PilX N-terminal domain-containing pilus assembly protein [Candidatus Saccharimonadales bacterium]|nr:PilX N-terminal domain-containing pilus assembly protein [Candidatus Saccharimonadales bacterium]
MKREKLNQSGFASLVVGLILVLVLALMTVGFSALVRREQSNTLNKQLSSQAYYAAETGINDAVRDLQLDPHAGAKTQCTKSNSYPDVVESNGDALDSSSQVGYTCVLVSVATNDLLYNTLSNTDWMAVQATSENPIDHMTIAWQNYSSPDCYQSSVNTANGGGNFKPLSSFKSGCAVGAAPTDAVEFSITPLDGAHYDRATLLKNTYQVILYPSTTGSTTTTYSQAGGVASQPYISGACGPHAKIGGFTQDGGISYCQATINSLPAGYNRFLVAMKTVYGTQTNVNITGFSGTNKISFTGTQAVIDATGKAQNVLRRIQVRVPLTAAAGTTNLPNALSGGDGICKRMVSSPSSPTTFYNVAGTTAGAGDSCNGAL